MCGTRQILKCALESGRKKADEKGEGRKNDKIKQGKKKRRERKGQKHRTCKLEEILSPQS